jgi:hypothetical protein
VEHCYTGPGCRFRPAQRQAREKPLDAARHHEIDVVLVWRLDRWSRSVTDLLATLQELGNWSISASDSWLDYHQERSIKSRKSPSRWKGRRDAGRDAGDKAPLSAVRHGSPGDFLILPSASSAPMTNRERSLQLGARDPGVMQFPFLLETPVRRRTIVSRHYTSGFCRVGEFVKKIPRIVSTGRHPHDEATIVDLVEAERRSIRHVRSGKHLGGRE